MTPSPGALRVLRAVDAWRQLHVVDPSHRDVALMLGVSRSWVAQCKHQLLVRGALLPEIGLSRVWSVSDEGRGLLDAGMVVVPVYALS